MKLVVKERKTIEDNAKNAVHLLRSPLVIKNACTRNLMSVHKPNQNVADFLKSCFAMVDVL